MAGEAEFTGPQGGWRRWLPYILIVASIWLGWQVIQSLMVWRAPPHVAVSIAPGSPEALRRLAESNYERGGRESARELAVASLRAAPFQTRALRVVGLADARMNRLSQADDELTLAGNWSLRDTAAHAWLVERRLRQGNYVSAFAHADTIARRNRDASRAVFELFIEAAVTDRRAVKPILDLVALKPIWRQDFLDTLYADERGPALLATVAVGLEPTTGRLSDVELAQLYTVWLRERRFAGLKALKLALGRPDNGPGVADGAFSQNVQLAPFAWTVGTGPGLAAEITADELDSENSALWVQTDAFSPGQAASQLLTLSPGDYRWTGRARVATEAPSSLLDWTVTCLETGAEIARLPVDDIPENGEWARFVRVVRVPATGCSMQWLAIKASPGNRRGYVVAWFDDFSVRPPAPTATDSAR